MLKLKKIFVAISLFAVASTTLFTSFEANALPSFSRQTGAACSQCHTQSFGPNLTPFGRDFKLGGYTMGGGKASNIPAVSALISGSFTNTNKDQTDVPAGYNKNNNFTFDSVNAFYAGKVYGKVGAFAEFAYDGVSKKAQMDNTDIRFADNLDVMDTPVTYGISLNNNPTVQDLWNTTAWGFPYNGSALQPGAGSSALIDGGLGAQVGGATAYTMINNLLYLEAGGYTSLSNGIQRGIGIPTGDRMEIDGAAPYWRVALQKDWKGHFFAVGHYGMMADVFAGRDHTAGTTDRYTDIAFDATYQYMANPKHIFEVKSTYIYEDQKLSAWNINNGLNPNAKSYLNTFKFNTSYTFDQTYGVTFAYNNVKGSNVSTLNTADDGTTFYDIGKPNSDYYTAELVYIPFGKSGSILAPWLNLRTSLQYIGFAKVNGSTQKSSDNNTFMLNGMLVF
ncbi:MAG: cytochrome C [Methylococcales bacterium]|nr:cytochrome C [Methylococcales bacterium]